MIQKPNRARRYRPVITPGRNAMSIGCPGCGAPPTWRCVALGIDSDGNTYEKFRLKHPHPERKQAWRDHKNKLRGNTPDD